MTIESGANVNVIDDEGNAALLLPVRGERLGLVRVLVSKCADVNVKDQRGKTALQWAQEKQKDRIEKILSSPPSCN